MWTLPSETKTWGFLFLFFFSRLDGDWSFFPFQPFLPQIFFVGVKALYFFFCSFTPLQWHPFPPFCHNFFFFYLVISSLAMTIVVYVWPVGNVGNPRKPSGIVAHCLLASVQGPSLVVAVITPSVLALICNAQSTVLPPYDDTKYGYTQAIMWKFTNLNHALVALLWSTVRDETAMYWTKQTLIAPKSLEMRRSNEIRWRFCHP